MTRDEATAIANLLWDLWEAHAIKLSCVAYAEEVIIPIVGVKHRRLPLKMRADRDR